MLPKRFYTQQEIDELKEKYEEMERIRKSPIHILKVILVWGLIFLAFREIFTNTKEDALLNAPLLDEPQQVILKPTEGEKLKIKMESGRTTAFIIPLATYKISARVLAKARMTGDGASDLAPYDVGLVWGDLMKDGNYRKIQTLNLQRRLVFRASNPENLKQLEKFKFMHHLSNNHLIPANSNVLKGIKSLRKYDKVYMEGYLVKCDITYKEMHLNPYESSLSREDGGDGACEVFYVTKIVSVRGSWQ